MNRCEDYPCCGHTDGSTCPPAPFDCCDTAADRYYDGFDVRGTDHDEDCDEYDGAPVYRDGMGPGDPVRCDND